MADLKLDVDKRMVTGKRLNSLRRAGMTPAHLYGRETESYSLQAPTLSVAQLLKAAGPNTIIDLTINGESASRSVVLRGVQRNPVTGALIHVDFLQISLTETLRAEVPLVLTGEAPAVHVYNGVLVQALDHLSVEALPMDIPPQIEVDISGLEELESSIFVRDLPVPDNVTVLADEDWLVVKVETPRIAAEIEAEEAAAEEEALAEAAAEAPGEEAGEAPAEGEGEKSGE